MVLNFPKSIKLYGTNIIPTVAEVATGVAAWKNMHVNWATDWPTWIKPQIDYAVSNGYGCNCIRMIGDYSGVFAGTFTQATYNANWVQLVSYCAGLGVRVYVTGGDQGQVSGMTNADIYGILNSLLAALSGYWNVIGVDVMQEQDQWADGTSAARTAAIYTGVKAGGTAFPLTFSVVPVWTGATCKNWIASIASSLDFLDFHIYPMNYDATAPLAAVDINFYQTTYPGLDIGFGEFGSRQSETYANNYGFCSNVLQLVKNDGRLRFGLQWAAQDQDTVSSNKWGMFDASWVPRYAFRAAMRQVTGGSLARAN